MKMISMKRAFILLWHGLTGIFACIANWFTVILGMNDDSKYGRAIRRVVGGCFALIMVMVAAAVIYGVGKGFYEELPRDVRYGEDYYDSRRISRDVTFYKAYWNEKGYIKTRDGGKTIKNIHWIAGPLGNDSLICYSDGKKRGYFNMYTGKPDIKPLYDHAWIFSDGLAAVDDNGRIKFIDAAGKVRIDTKIPYMIGSAGYVFHNGHCAIHGNSLDKIGLIDKQGNWVLKPEFSSIEPVDSFWVVNKGEERCVMDCAMKTVIPYLKGRIWINDQYISVTLDNHIIQRYNRQGEIIEDFYINEVSHLTYQTDELRYITSREYATGGDTVYEADSADPRPVEKTAKCRLYEAESGWYGLMSPDGKILTPPSYCDIVAIGYDMYLCKDNNEDGVILDGKGKRVR